MSFSSSVSATGWRVSCTSWAGAALWSPGYSQPTGRGWVFLHLGWGIFWFLLMAFCGQPELLSDLVHVCHRSYFSAGCFPVSASAGRTEADVKTQLQMMRNWLLFASPALMLLPPVLFFGKKFSLGPSEMTLAPKILTTPPSKQPNNPTTTTSTTINYKNTNDAMKSWISLCHLCKASRRNQRGVWLLVFWKPWMCQLVLEWLAPAGWARCTVLWPAKSWISPARCAGQVPVLVLRLAHQVGASPVHPLCVLQDWDPEFLEWIPGNWSGDCLGLCFPLGAVRGLPVTATSLRLGAGVLASCRRNWHPVRWRIPSSVTHFSQGIGETKLSVFLA